MQTQEIVRFILPAHILAGGLALVFGYAALYAAKGASLHRKSGMMFVYTMPPMALTGMLISAIEGVAPAINIPFALLTIYLVITGVAAVRQTGVDRATRVRRHLWRMCLALVVAAMAFFGAPGRVPLPGALRALPILMVVVTMSYWLWRLRVRRPSRRVVSDSGPHQTVIAEA
jgi:uncharacterized membrane protein